MYLIQTLKFILQTFFIALSGSKRAEISFKIYRVKQWNWNKVWLYCSGYGAVLELKNMALIFRHFWFRFSKISKDWFFLLDSSVSQSTWYWICCIYLYDISFALIFRHFIELSQYFTVWLDWYQIQKITRRN